MSWDPTPWAVGGGAVHSPEMGRLLAYATASGAEGVVLPSDLRVTALPVPGGKVRVNPGACILNNRNPGASHQSYVGRNIIAHDVDIASTGSGGGRRDLVVARVEDPQYAGWQRPSDMATGQFIFTRVLQNVPASAISSPLGARNYLKTLNYPAIALAGIDIPASTATITNAMITNLRRVAMPRKERYLFTHGLTSGQEETLDSQATPGEAWPDVTNWRVDVPEWATFVDVVGTWAQVRVPPGYAVGELWARLGAASDPSGYEIQRVTFGSPDSDRTSRQTYVVAARITVPVGLRGTNIPVYLKGRHTTGAASTMIRLDAASAVTMDLEFQEIAD